MNNNTSNNIEALCAQFKHEPKNNTILGNAQEDKKLLIQVFKEDAAIKKIRAGDLPSADVNSQWSPHLAISNK